MKIAKRPDPERLHVLAATLRVWLLDVLVWLGGFLGGTPPRPLRLWLRREIAAALRDTHMLTFLLAFARMTVPVRPARAMRPPSTPPGFARAPMGGGARGFGRAVRLRGLSIPGKLASLRAIFDNLGAVVRKVLRHLRRRRLGGVALLPVAPPASRLAAVAHVAAVGVDTS